MCLVGWSNRESFVESVFPQHFRSVTIRQKPWIFSSLASQLALFGFVRKMICKRKLRNYPQPPLRSCKAGCSINNSLIFWHNCAYWGCLNAKLSLAPVLIGLYILQLIFHFFIIQSLLTESVCPPPLLWRHICASRKRSRPSTAKEN